MPFLLKKKPPEGTAPASTRGLEASNHLVWSHPITLRSLVVKHTAWTQNWANFDTFDTFSSISKNTICFQKFHINDLELSFSATFAESRCASFPCWKRTRIFMIFNDFNNFMVLGPRPLGPMGPFIFDIFWKFVLWSGTYLEVFLWCLWVQGTP